jgi:hypothetical protein
MQIKSIIIAVTMLTTFCSAAADDTLTTGLQGTTQQHGLIVSMQSKSTPVVINQIHSWIILVRDKNGDPVNDADIRVDGAMPEHDHGLPTQPQVTQLPGNGEYLLEGMKFHMHGRWQLTMSISVNGNEDTVVFDLNL